MKRNREKMKKKEKNNMKKRGKNNGLNRRKQKGDQEVLRKHLEVPLLLVEFSMDEGHCHVVGLGSAGGRCLYDL